MIGPTEQLVVRTLRESLMMRLWSACASLRIEPITLPALRGMGDGPLAELVRSAELIARRCLMDPAHPRPKTLEQARLLAERVEYVAPGSSRWYGGLDHPRSQAADSHQHAGRWHHLMREARNAYAEKVAAAVAPMVEAGKWAEAGSRA